MLARTHATENRIRTVGALMINARKGVRTAMSSVTFSTRTPSLWTYLVQYRVCTSSAGLRQVSSRLAAVDSTDNPSASQANAVQTFPAISKVSPATGLPYIAPPIACRTRPIPSTPSYARSCQIARSSLHLGHVRHQRCVEVGRCARTSPPLSVRSPHFFSARRPVSVSVSVPSRIHLFWFRRQHAHTYELRIASRTTLSCC